MHITLLVGRKPRTVKKNNSTSQLFQKMFFKNENTNFWASRKLRSGNQLSVWTLISAVFLSVSVRPVHAELTKVCALHHRNTNAGVCGKQLAEMMENICIIYNKRSGPPGKNILPVFQLTCSRYSLAM